MLKCRVQLFLPRDEGHEFTIWDKLPDMLYLDPSATGRRLDLSSKPETFSFLPRGVNMQNCRNVKTKDATGKPVEPLSRSKTVPEIQACILSEINNRNDSFIVIDETSRIVLWNHAMERMFGYSAADVVGKDFNIIIPEEYHSLNKYRMRLMLQTGVADFSKTPVELVVMIVFSRKRA